MSVFKLLNVPLQFRNMKFEDLYLMGSPFPSPDTTAEDYNWGDDSNDLRVTRSMYSARVMSSPVQMDFTALLYEGPAAHEVIFFNWARQLGANRCLTSLDLEPGL